MSWIRHKDTHLLTLGLYSYTKDPRLSAIHRSNSEDWVLEIRNTQTQDAGQFLCFFICLIFPRVLMKSVLHLILGINDWVGGQGRT